MVQHQVVLIRPRPCNFAILTIAINLLQSTLAPSKIGPNFWSIINVPKRKIVLISTHHSRIIS